MNLTVYRTVGLWLQENKAVNFGLWTWELSFGKSVSCFNVVRFSQAIKRRQNALTFRGTRFKIQSIHFCGRELHNSSFFLLCISFTKHSKNKLVYWLRLTTKISPNINYNSFLAISKPIQSTIQGWNCSKLCMSNFNESIEELAFDVVGGYEFKVTFIEILTCTVNL